MENLTGQQIDRYKIFELLGKGGTAMVYKGYDTRLEREVAIKIIRLNAFPLEDLHDVLKRFEREVKSLARLSHPNIVKVMDYGKYEGSPFLVLEYFPGGTLKQKIGEPITWQEAARLLLPIARGIEYAHNRGVIHRDIKPANILITENGEPTLSDFGIAKLFQGERTTTITTSGGAIGTPEYMALEQWTGDAIPKSDIYSLGVIFYEMITGRRPYIADTPGGIFLKQVTESLPLPSSFVQNLPESVEEFLLKALAREPEDRYESMGEMADAFEDLQRDTGRQFAVETSPNEEKRTLKKTSKGKFPIRPNITMIISGLVALVLLAVFGLPPLIGKPEPTPAATSAIYLTLTPIPATATEMPALTPALTFTPEATPTLKLDVGSTVVRTSDGMVMMYVPEGEFIMGSNDGLNNERPEHKAYLSAYWIDSTEVTNAMYAKCVLAGNCKNLATSERSSKYADHPVTYIKWGDAQSYCLWVEARLPTEAEWEKAARGTDGRIYPWGNKEDTTRFYFYNNNRQVVGSYPSGASPYGLLDMTGGVLEWVNDWYGETYYQGSPSLNPSGPDAGTNRVLRSGVWNGSDSIVRSSVRNWLIPSFTNFDIGFRCARDVNP